MKIEFDPLSNLQDEIYDARQKSRNQASVVMYYLELETLVSSSRYICTITFLKTFVNQDKMIKIEDQKKKLFLIS